jgi:hypothetical protein
MRVLTVMGMLRPVRMMPWMLRVTAAVRMVMRVVHGVAWVQGMARVRVSLSVDWHAPEQSRSMGTSGNGDGVPNGRPRFSPGAEVVGRLLGGTCAQTNDLPRNLEFAVFLAHPLELHLEQVRGSPAELPAE